MHLSGGLLVYLIVKLSEKIEFTTALVNVVCDLYPEELKEQITTAFANEKVDEWYVDMEWVKHTLALGKETYLKNHIFEDDSQLPIDDIKKCMSGMAVFQPRSSAIDSHNNDWQYINARTTPKIGRNDACPCDSGKKYKKCCLQQVERTT